MSVFAAFSSELTIFMYYKHLYRVVTFGMVPLFCCGLQ